MLKVTDDIKVRISLYRLHTCLGQHAYLTSCLAGSRQCLKYKTYSSIILNRFESLNLRLLTSMASPRVRAVPTIAPSAVAVPIEGKLEGSSVPETTVGAAATTGGATGKSASKKKKKGKK